MAAFWDKSAGEYKETHEVADKETWQQVLAELIGHIHALYLSRFGGYQSHLSAGGGYAAGQDCGDGKGCTKNLTRVRFLVQAREKAFHPCRALPEFYPSLR